MTDRYAVFGNPIAHSRSPDIHAAFAEQTDQQLVYTKQLVEPGRFREAADEFFRAGGQGLNVTVPFKEDAFQYADDLTQRAKTAGAVNTLILRPDGSVLGDNTDGIGMVRDITERLGWPLQGKRVLLLGAGGAVRGVILPCLEEKPVSLTIANRTVAKASDLAASFSHIGKVEACGYDALDERQFDLVINGTSASLQGDLPPIPTTVFAPNAAAYDMMYSAQLTPFLAWAQAQGVTALADGLGMLVGQAAEAFAQWRGVQPDPTPVLKALRRAMAEG
jgi:shikimate dehydrogenase